MRNYLQVIRSLLGDATFSNAQPVKNKDIEPFQYFRLQLQSDKYRGFLPVWDVAIVLDVHPQRSVSEIEEVYEAARQIVEIENKSDQYKKIKVPLLLVSDDPRAKLQDSLTTEVKHVFFVDQNNIPGIRPGPNNPITSPLVKVVRNHLTQIELPGFMFSPYLRNRPAEGWRFFGRKKELNLLIDSDESFFVVGGRRIGKTSLLREVKNRLTENNNQVIFADVEACQNEDQVIRMILQSISEKDLAAAIRRQKALTESLISSVLRRTISKGGRVILILDELGNVISRLPKEQWKIFGTFREFSHSGKVRIIMSCFQELFQKQALDGSGPLVNFGSVLRLHALTHIEIEEMVIAPLLHWARIKNTRALLQLVLTSIGRHPYILQTFCQEIFQRVIKKPDVDVLNVAKEFIASESDYVECFREAVEETFTRSLTPILRYLYLLRCQEADLSGIPWSEVAIDEDWVDSALIKIGYDSSLDDRNALLEELELRGLIDQKDDRRASFIIVVPMVYYYHKKSGINMELLFVKFRRSIDLEYERWGLRKQ